MRSKTKAGGEIRTGLVRDPESGALSMPDEVSSPLDDRLPRDPATGRRPHVPGSPAEALQRNLDRAQIRPINLDRLVKESRKAKGGGAAVEPVPADENGDVSWAAIESVEQRKAQPRAPKKPGGAGAPLGVTPPDVGGEPAARPKIDGPRQVWTEDYKPEQSVRLSKFEGGWKGWTQRLLAKVANPQDGIYGESGLTRALIEHEGEAPRLTREGMERQFGKTDGKFQVGGVDVPEWYYRGWEIARDNPEVRQIPRKLREGVRLTPEESAAYRENKPLWDAFTIGSKETGAGFFRNLTESRALGFADGDLGPNYYPRTFRTVGDLLRLRSELSFKQVLDIVLGNLESSRVTKLIPNDNPFETAVHYTRQAVKKQTLRPLIDATKSMIETAEAKKLGQEAGAYSEFLRYNILNEIPQLDVALREMKFRALESEKLSPGTSFESSGALGPKGTVEIVRQTGLKNVAGVEEPVYRVKVNGRELPVEYTRSELVAMKYAEVAIDRSPATALIDSTNRWAARYVIAGSSRSFFNATVGNAARVISGATSPGDLFHGAKQAVKWATRQLDEATLREYADQGIIERQVRDLIDDTPTSKFWSVADHVAFANVWVPDVIARITAYEMGKKAYARSEGWSPQRVRAEAAHYASMVSDLARNGARSPYSYEPVYKLVSFLSNAALREGQQALRQLRGGPKDWARLAANVGIRFGATYALFSFIAGETDPKKAARKLADLFPWIGIFQGRVAPGLQILGGKALAAGELADDAIGAPLRSAFGKRPMTQQRRDNLTREVQPVSLQMAGAAARGELKPFIVSPRSK